MASICSAQSSSLSWFKFTKPIDNVLSLNKQSNISVETDNCSFQIKEFMT